MKRTCSVLAAFTTLIIACNNKAKETTTVTSKDGTEQVTIDPKKLQEAAQDMQKIKEELTNLKPLTADELKAYFPAQLMGAPAADLEVSAFSGASVAEAK